MSLEAIKYAKGKLEIIDQLLLPQESKYITVKNTEDGWKVINKMQVRGAPAIAVVAALSLAAELYPMNFASVEKLNHYVKEKLDYLVSSRPTAVNIADTRNKLMKQLHVWQEEEHITAEDVKATLLAEIENMPEDDVATNQRIGKYGADDILQRCGNEAVRILTHCNTGSLATCGYGTALGIVRSLHQKDRLLQCYCTETRPYNQGARLTAYELVQDNLPGTLICDNMAASLMREKKIAAVVVGADRVVANGDTANKIGTYQLAIIAKYNDVLFYVAAPSTSIDLNLLSGEEITIEERQHKEMTHIKGIQLAPTGINCWNPAFDVTPADLITGGIVTEFGVFKPQELQSRLAAALRK